MKIWITVYLLIAMFSFIYFFIEESKNFKKRWEGKKNIVKKKKRKDHIEGYFGVILFSFFWPLGWLFEYLDRPRERKTKPKATNTKTSVKVENITKEKFDDLEKQKHEELNILLYKAAANGNTSKVKSLLEQKASKYAKHNNGLNSLFIAIINGHEDTANLILNFPNYSSGPEIKIDGFWLNAFGIAKIFQRNKVIEELKSHRENYLGPYDKSEIEYVKAKFQEIITSSFSDTVHYDGETIESFYERMSRDLIAEHGPLGLVDYVSHYPKFEIWFCYEDGTRIYSGQRTGNYDIHFLSLGYTGEGPRYARHFLAAAGFDLTSKQIESIKPGDSIQQKDGKTVIILEKNKVVEGSGVVTFSHEEKKIVAGFPATYRYYKGPSKAAAIDFLDKQNITTQSFFIIVETPEGIYYKDRQGVFKS